LKKRSARRLFFRAARWGELWVAGGRAGRYRGIKKELDFKVQKKDRSKELSRGATYHRETKGFDMVEKGVLGHPKKGQIMGLGPNIRMRTGGNPRASEANKVVQ